MSRLDIQCDWVERLLIAFLRKEASKFGFSRVLLGLSGGIDSALCAALAARAFGPEHVLGVLLPYRSSNPASEADARTVAQHLRIPVRRVEITEMVEGYFRAVPTDDRMRRGNAMARSRMIALYDLSVEWKGLVLGTSNKTEILLGYSTQFGDAASALNPLGDLYKHQVFQLARYLGLPSCVLEKAPSADLFEGQTDEGEIGYRYADLDALLFEMVDERRSEAELIARGFDPEFVRTIARRMAANQYKRMPPVIAKLSERTVNHDFRYLRSWGR